MGILFIVIGIVLLISGNVGGMYKKAGRPGIVVRSCLTIGGVGLIVAGIHYLGIFPFRMFKN